MSDHWQQIIEECRTLEQTGLDGKRFLDAKRVVEFAREHPESALHGEFEWNDELAADEHRLFQARQIIVRVRVFIDESKPEEEQVKYRVYTSVPDDTAADGRTRTDKLTVDILADPVSRRALIVRLLKAALGETKGYPQLEELDKWRKYTQRLIDEYTDTE